MAMAAVKLLVGLLWKQGRTTSVAVGGGGGHDVVVVAGKDMAVKDTAKIGVSKMAGRRRILQLY